MLWNSRMGKSLQWTHKSGPRFHFGHLKTLNQSDYILNGVLNWATLTVFVHFQGWDIREALLYFVGGGREENIGYAVGDPTEKDVSKITQWFIVNIQPMK